MPRAHGAAAHHALRAATRVAACRILCVEPSLGNTPQVQHGLATTIRRPELDLLLACTNLHPGDGDDAAIRQRFAAGIDWTAFAREAIAHDLTNLAGRTLARVAPDMVPRDLLDAFRLSIDQTDRRNRTLVAELHRVLGSVADAGIEAISFKGPAFDIRAYGNTRSRMFGDIGLLVHPGHVDAATAALRTLGYERAPRLTKAQLDLMRDLQGREVLFRTALGIRVHLHTRFAPLTFGCDLDAAGVWRRARPMSLDGQPVLTPAPEDDILVLALQGGLEQTWSIGWACDVQACIASHPDLDWFATQEHARAQGLLRMLLLTVSLARTVFAAKIPNALLAEASADPIVNSWVGRIIQAWQTDDPGRRPVQDGFSMDRLRLQQGAIRQARYVARSMFLPTPQHVARIPLPRRFTHLAAYVPVKFAHDLALFPLLQASRNLRRRAARLQDAFAKGELALALMPISSDRKRHYQRRMEARRMLAADSKNPAAWQILGDAMFGLGRYEEAVVAYDQVLTIAPENPAIWRKRAEAVRTGSKPRLDADDAAAPDPQDAQAWVRRAGALYASQRYSEAAAASDRALEIAPKHLPAMRIGIRSRISCCDWRKRNDDERRIDEGLRADLPIITPFNLRAVCDSEAQKLVAARIWARPYVQAPARALCRNERYGRDRLRLGYLSAEFHDHPAAIQIVGVLEHHDRTRVEVVAISSGPDRPGAMRARIEHGCDRFVDVHSMSDAEAATVMHDMEIDIAIDLNGYTGAGRPGVLAHRPAPLQVGYLVNTGTLGAPFLDYIIADRTVVPPETFPHYSEKIVYLPHSYQCNDGGRPVPRPGGARADHGLPEAGFVFCCFNNNYKITPAVYDVWMRLLRACPGSVLWVLAGELSAMHNLRREAAARGVAPERLVFAPYAPVDDHLARHHLADLFLDTLPCNAHATAADALWAGLPMVTCLGNTFAGRVGASVLQAIGLPELVATSLAEYEELALALARAPERLAAIRATLMRNRATEPLFDTARTTRSLEAAYTAIWRRQQAGLAPAALAIAPDMSHSEIELGAEGGGGASPARQPA